MRVISSSFPHLLPLLVALLGVAHAARASVIVVTTTADDLVTNGNCTLREAVQAANTDAAVDACSAGGIGPDVIALRSGTYSLTRMGTDEDDNQTGDLDVTSALAIVGAGRSQTAIDATAIDRVLDVDGATVRLEGLTLRHGNAGGGSGGGIRALAGAHLQLVGVDVRENAAFDGAGIAGNGCTLEVTGGEIAANDAGVDAGGLKLTDSTATIVDALIDGNTAVSSVGGVSLNGSGTVQLIGVTIAANLTGIDAAGIGVNGPTVALRNVTIADNAGQGDGGGLRASAGSVSIANATIAGNAVAGAAGGIDVTGTATITVQNSIVSGNTATNGPAECRGAIASGGYNLLGSLTGCTFTATAGDLADTAPLLAPLASNGGPTATRLPLDGSPAIDHGNPVAPGSGGTACEAFDQRRGSRASTRCDAGAVERSAVPVATTTTTTSTIRASTTTRTSTTTGASTTTTTQGTLCTDVFDIHPLTLRLGNLRPPIGDEAVLLRGRIALPASGATTLDPFSSGLEIAILDLGREDPRSFGFTSAAGTAVPGGGPGTGCDRRDGWRKLVYRNRSDAIDPPACTAHSANGLKEIVLRDRRAKGGGVEILVSAYGSLVPDPVGPLRVEVVLGQRRALLTGCAAHTFAPADCRRKRGVLICR